MSSTPSSGGDGASPPQPAGRLYVLVSLGWPIYGRAGYRGVGTVVCASRADAHRAAADLEPSVDRNGFGAGPVRPMLPRVAGMRLLAEALAADGQRGRTSPA